MKQKLYYLLALTFLLLIGTGKNVVHAANDPVFSAKNTATSNVSYTKSATTEITTNITIKGGKMYAVNNQSSDKNLQASGGFCMTNNNTYFKIELNQALAVGDVISAKYTGGTREKDNVTYNLGIIVNTTETTSGNGVSGACSATSASSTSLGSTLSYTVKDDDEYVGKTILYVYRAYGATQYFDEFTVTREIVDTRTAVTLSFDSPTANANLGENFTAPTLTVDPVSAESEVTYSSSATNVATVDAASGNVTIKAVGTTTITAAISGSETYKDASASYTLTVVDPNVKTVTATFAFNTGAAGQVATVSAENVFSVTSVSVADMTYAGVGSDQGVTGTKMQPASQASDNKSQYTKFTVIPKKGITFTPKKVSFDAMRWGTNGSNKLHYYAECGSTSVELGDVNPNRNGQGNGWSHYEHNITNIQATRDNPFSLACYVYGLATDKQISFANIVIEGEYSGTPAEVEIYTVSSSVNIEGAGTVSQLPAGASLEEETTVTFTATANTGYAFVNWTDDNNQDEVLGTNATYTINSLSANTAITANFKALTAVSFDKGNSGAYGEVPATQYGDGSFNVTMPANKTLYKKGYTLKGWRNGNEIYTIGQAYQFSENTTLTPVFEQNGVSQLDFPGETTVTWNFGKSNEAAAYSGAESANVKQVIIGSETIDLGIQMAGGTNAGRKDEWLNTQDKDFVVPVSTGAVITAKVYYGDANHNTVTFNGEVITYNENTHGTTGNVVYTYTYTGTDDAITVNVGNQFLSYISVKYPYIEKGTPSNLAITIPANGEWSVDLDDPSADKTLQIAYSSYSNGVVTYSTSNASIATVSETGLITAKSNGTATITVSQAATETYQAGTAQIAVTVTGGVTIIGTDEISLVYTTSGYDSNTKTWTNGTYTLVGSNGVDGNTGQCFKLMNSTYTLKVPANIRVDKIEYTGYDYNSSVTEGEISTATVTVDGATTMSGWNAYYEHYSSAQNTTIAREITHNTGEDITLAVTGAGQIIGTMKLYVSEIELTTAPTLVSQSNTTTHNGHVVLNFSQPMAGATATIDGQSVTAEGGSSALTFYYWGLDYGKQVTFTLSANGLEDEFGNAYEGEDITINFTIDAKPTLTKKKFDVIVGTEGNEDLQAVLDSYKNYSGSERKYIFIPDGTYKLTGNSSFKTNGNETGYVYNETTGEVSDATVYPEGTYTDNAMTQLRSSNLSIIGQSKDNTILYNIPYIPGISYTSTLEFRYGSDNYLQDLTLKNMYAGGAHDKGVAVAFYDRGTRTIAKNISCWSNQDTYVSNGARDYYETSTFAGTVDFICGNGDVWFQQCDLIINNRSGNVITAPSTAATEKWGYVFYENTISRAEGATLVTDNSWDLGRPWKESPAATFLYTTMNTLPKDAGWTHMNDGKVLRFHEYGSKNAGGSPLDLSNRSIAACNGDAASDDPVLTAEQAAKYTIHNVLGGTDGWDPTEYTAQVSVTGLALNGYTLTWDDNEDALCWMVFKDGVYFDNVITNSVTADGAGEYTVRAANARGGLGEGMTVTVSTEAITTNTFGNASHVAGKALDFSGVEGLKAYIATAADGAGITLAEVTAVPAGTAFVVQATEKAQQTYYIPTTTENVTHPSQNVFEGSATEPTATESGYTYYALSKSKGMFAKVGSSVASIPAGKAFVKISNNLNAKETLMFFFDGETTGIVDAEAAEAKQNGVRKQFINGQLMIIKGDKQYNAAGGEF